MDSPSTVRVPGHLLLLGQPKKKKCMLLVVCRYPTAEQTAPPSAFGLFRWGAARAAPSGLSATQLERCQMLR